MLKLSIWEQFIVGLAISFLEAIATQVEKGSTTVTIQLSGWESFAVGAALSLLEFLQTIIKNTTEAAALQAVIAVLQSLLQGVSSTKAVEVAGIQAAILFLQKLVGAGVAIEQ